MAKRAPMKDEMTILQAENARLVGVIAGAIVAMDEGRYGDTRRILKTGADKPVMTQSGVLAGNGGVA